MRSARALVGLLVLTSCADGNRSAPLAPTSEIAASTSRARVAGAHVGAAPTPARSPATISPALLGTIGRLRAWVAEGSPASLQPAGPALPSLLELDHPLPVVTERADAVQLLDVWDDRVLIWVARSALMPVTRRRVLLMPAPSDAASLAARWSELDAGTPVTIDERRGTWTRVTHRAWDFDVTGWIPADALGDIYEEPGSRDDVSEGDDAVGPPIRRGTVVRTGPRATAAAVATMNNEWLHATVLRRTRGWVEIEIAAEEHALIRGFVPASALLRAEAPGVLGCSDGGALPAEPAPITVPDGTCLRIQPGGEVVGVTRGDGTGEVTRSELGWWVTTSYTSAGPVPLYLEARDAEMDARARRDGGLPAFVRCLAEPTPTPTPTPFLAAKPRPCGKG
jgi:hypothetical protein